MALRPCLPILAALLAMGAAASARTLEVGLGKEFKQPSDAAAAARAGDRILIQPGEYFDCATLKANNLTVEGVGDPAKVVLTDKTCGGKALLITTGNGITVRNLTLTRARVPDGNGAGIRNEAADLTVDGVRFINDQDGILSTTVDGGTLLVRNSLFDRNGVCLEGAGCAHGIYAGAAALVRVENTTFTGTKQGHSIKSRALRTEVIGCTIKDGEDGNRLLFDRGPERRRPRGAELDAGEGPAGREPFRRHRHRQRGREAAHARDHHREQHLPQRRQLADGLREQPHGDRRRAARQQAVRLRQAPERRRQGDAVTARCAAPCPG